MTVLEFAMFRYAAGLMTPEELKEAQKLAELGDRGDKKAAQKLREIVLRVIRQHR